VPMRPVTGTNVPLPVAGRENTVQCSKVADRRPAMRSIWMPIFWTPFTHVRLHQKLTPLSPH
jgi:hypothetical protein